MLNPPELFVTLTRAYAVALIAAGADLTYAQGRQLITDVINLCDTYNRLYDDYTAAVSAAAALEAAARPAEPPRRPRSQTVNVDEKASG